MDYAAKPTCLPFLDSVVGGVIDFVGVLMTTLTLADPLTCLKDFKLYTENMYALVN